MYSTRKIQLIAMLISASSLLHAETGNMMDKHMSADTPVSHSRHMDMMKNMDAQLDAMKDMHQKMTAAKTDAERQILMKDHLKIMQDGMGMMSKHNEDGMHCLSAASHGKHSSRKHRQLMDKQMKMMQSMMQMMKDGMPVQSTP
jgi:ATP-dependent Lon protease